MGEHRPTWAGDLRCRVVGVQTTSASYDVCIGRGLLARVGAGARAALGRAPARVMLIHDEALPAACVRMAVESLVDEGSDVHVASMRADEREKSIQRAHELLTRCADAGLDRHDLVVALGGGLVGDVAGFVAATYMRGITVLQCPTTLLAMVDASVGGKTGVNLESDVDGTRRLLKNLVGAFHQPCLVIADLETLQSLDDREFTSGLAECVKHAMIGGDWGDPGLLAWTADHAASICRHDGADLDELIERNVRIKARVVAADEREEAADRPGRMLLNLGHTFGHAIEPLPDLRFGGAGAPTRLLHGEAVALGLCCSCRCAAVMGLIDEGYEKQIRALLDAFKLPTDVAGLPGTARIVAAMRRDKKASGGTIHLVLPAGTGRCRVVDGVTAMQLEVAIDSIRAITPTTKS